MITTIMNTQNGRSYNKIIFLYDNEKKKQMVITYRMGKITEEYE